jgi:glycosyltransferase involved in cell wall biosynthesis
MWNLKRRWFTGIENMTIVTPSQWLADLVKQSYLKNYPVNVINNGIDLAVFKPTESDFRNRHGLVGKKVVLGVAFGWGERKGLDVFVELSKRLPEDYRIVLVGTNSILDESLPADIVSIHKTQNQTELAEIYTAADVFANPTREEVLGLVNVESLACGTPVVTFKTGGSPECIDETCGSVVPCDDIDAMEKEIRRICEETPYSKDACLVRAQSFDMNERFEEYVKLYKEFEKKCFPNCICVYFKKKKMRKFFHGFSC